MKTLDSGQQKIEKISNLLRRDTLEPAEAQAHKLIEEGRMEARELVDRARREVEEMERLAKERIDKERRVFESSLRQGASQGLESLRQDVEKLFATQLNLEVVAQSADPQLIAKLIEAMCTAIEKEGTEVHLSALIPKHVDVSKVNGLLAERLLKMLHGGSVEVGDFNGGAQIKLRDKNVTIDLTDETLRELLSRYVRKDFRKLFFA